MGANLPPSPSDDDEDLAPLAEINVTPLVDVMLVLLIIFMVTAPLMVAGVPLKLPQSATASDTPPPKPLVVSMAADGKLYIRDEAVERDALVSRLEQLPSEEKEQTAYVRADKDLPYGTVMSILGDVAKAGFARISLLSEAKPGQ
jgi:biopolymer transport protein TolR